MLVRRAIRCDCPAEYCSSILHLDKNDPCSIISYSQADATAPLLALASLLLFYDEDVIIVSTPQAPIKLIAIDIHQTLLQPQKHITPRTRDAIQAAREAGIIVTLATGRRYHNSLIFAEELGIDIPIILYDGALIVEHPQGTVLHSHQLQAHIAQEVVEILVEYKIQPVVHHMRDNIEETWTGHAEFDNDWVSTYFSFTPHNLQRVHYDNCCVGQADPLRVLAFAPEEITHTLIPAISTLDCSWNIISSGNYGTAEMAIMHKMCSKASGVEALARHLQIPLSQVMAIGDNNNDIEMLQSVGWGVAMGQASAQVKAMAHATTASNTEDGVALAIERYALACDRQYCSNSSKRPTCR